MENKNNLKNRHLHVELPPDMDDRFRKLCPEKGIRSIIVRRLILAYVVSCEEGIQNIDLKRLSI